MLTTEAITARRSKQLAQPVERVTFGVKSFYGLSRQSVPLPISDTQTIESGQVCVMIDPDADQGGNIGTIDYAGGKLKVRYAVQAVFPGLYELLRAGDHDPRLLAPVRMIATDDCILTGDLRGWHAFGCLDFLPGSVWAGASGG
jgi:hypothetical protein